MQSFPGFELVLSSPFPLKITVTPRPPSKTELCDDCNINCMKLKLTQNNPWSKCLLTTATNETGKWRPYQKDTINETNHWHTKIGFYYSSCDITHTHTHTHTYIYIYIYIYIYPLHAVSRNSLECYDKAFVSHVVRIYFSKYKVKEFG